MRRYKLVIHILVILSVFNFVPVLAAPVAVQEVREACADVAPDGGEDMIIVPWKRAEEMEDPSWYHGSTQASPGSGSDYSLQHPPASMSDYASGVHQETTNPIELPSSASGGTELPWYSSKPGTTSKIPLASSVRTKTNKWVPTTEIEPAPSSSDEMRRPSYASGGTELPWYSKGEMRPERPQYASGGTKPLWYSLLVPPPSSMRTKSDKWVPTTEIELGSSSSGSFSSGKITPASSSKVLPPSEQITPASLIKSPPPSEQIIPASSNKVLLPSEQVPPASSRKVLPPLEQIPPASSSRVPPPSEQITPTPSSRVLPLSEQDGYLAQTPTKQPKLQFKSFLIKVTNKSKSFLSKLASKLKIFCWSGSCRVPFTLKP